MGTRIIDGNALAAELKRQLSEEMAALEEKGIRPGLATVLIGSPYEAEAYEKKIRNLAGDLGCHYTRESLPEDTCEADVMAAVGKLNADPRVSGILILKPLPESISEAAVHGALAPKKDIEAVHPENAGLLALGRPRYVPSTPAACFHALDSYLASWEREPAEFYSRSNLVVVGRSNNVGKPLVSLGFSRNATVTSCDVHTYNAGRLREFTLRADILIVAAGVPWLIDASYVREGVIAVDVGINPVEDPETGETKLVGDLDFESVAEKAEAITPVPGGIGPVTDAWLLNNAILAAKTAAGLDPSGEPAARQPFHSSNKIYNLQNIRK